MSSFYPSESDQIQDASGNIINPSKEDGNLANIKTNTDKIPSLGQSVSATSVPVVIASDQPAISVMSTPNFATRSDTFTSTTSGTIVDKHTAPLSSFAIEVKGTGASATLWTVVLEGSLDGTNFNTILIHQTSTGDGTTFWSGALKSPSLYFRSRVTTLSLGSATNIVVTVLGMQ